MLYSGHFSFDEVGDAGKERHGYFTCVVQAGTPELALQKFKQRIYTIKDELKEPLFQGIHAIYVEDIVEISDSPEDPVITRFQSSDGPFPKSRSCSLPTSDTTAIKAYQWVPESDTPADKEWSTSSQEYKEASPFILFS
ncbi:MAG: hypothetical protein D3926_13035 [Desulfobacteraceae bacterium]|nr:MAG: hypothetical protein D3926_13035 [Desulfobacteraceae bacterium]